MAEKLQSIKSKPGLSSNIFAATLVWLVVGISLHIFWQDLLGIFFVLAEIIRVLYWCVSFMLLFWMLFLLLQKRITSFWFVSLIVIGFFIAGSIVLFKSGMRYGMMFRFYLHKPEYERIIKELEQYSPQNHQNENFFYYGSSVIVDQCPPQRVAFQLPGGLLDNFQAVVYDPSGDVKELQRSNGNSHWNDPELNPIKQLFGGEMFFCEPIRDVWYFCQFT